MRVESVRARSGRFEGGPKDGQTVHRTPPEPWPEVFVLTQGTYRYRKAPNGGAVYVWRKRP